MTEENSFKLKKAEYDLANNHPTSRVLMIKFTFLNISFSSRILLLCVLSLYLQLVNTEIKPVFVFKNSVFYAPSSSIALIHGNSDGLRNFQLQKLPR